MSWTSEYNEDEVVQDLTKPLSKIWDVLIPMTYPYVLTFQTNFVKEVKHIKRLGPYHMTERFIHYDCDVKIDYRPLVDAGWTGGEIKEEVWKAAYGQNYFDDLRSKMLELLKYAGLNFSSFDFGGELSAKVDNYTKKED